MLSVYLINAPGVVCLVNNVVLVICATSLC
jgi:hypothetical protein